MKRVITVFLVLCSFLLLSTQRTLAQEVLPVGDEYGKDTESTVYLKQDVEEEPLTEGQPKNGTANNLIDLEKLRLKESGTNNAEIEDQSSISATLQSKESLSEESSHPQEFSSSEGQLEGSIDADISQSNDSGSRLQLEGAISADISQSNDSEIEAELKDKIGETAAKILATEIEAAIKENLESSQSVAEVIENEIITTTVAAEQLEGLVSTETQPEFTTLMDEDISTTLPTTSNELEEPEVSTTQDESDVTNEPLESSTEQKTTELDTEDTDTTTTTPVAVTESPCAAPGTYSVENNCRAFISCKPTATNQLIKAQTDCPTGQAYNPALLRCSRDLSPCADALRCIQEGTFADPQDNSSYYWCVASRLTDAFHIYHIQCGNGQIYTHELGKCFVDMTNLQDLPLNYELYMSKSPDEECVREEVKVLKAEEKAKLKEAKLREKIRKKYEKELLKKAAKAAKEQAKLLGISLEDETPFNCVEEGNFAAAAESFFDYFICVNKKDKYKAVGMKCVDGQSFSTAQNVCTP
ncbi:papilin isoform X1 [Bactrocera neohumeralis]|uniref:papilin isoform X1 n=1 Tax=Bactrocera neohumeralis TaxID=98809 RepID=UPI0021652FC9|nr:papilin isoform X1 [Bactrocera neohumeralis]